MRETAAIIGAGVAGLSCAYALSKDGRFSPVVLEAERRLGGKILSDPAAGTVFEAGPDSFITAKPWALALVKELGLEGELLPTHPEKKDVYVYTRGRMRKFPDGLMLMAPTKVLPFLASDLLGWPAKIRMGLEIFLPARRDDGDESMGDFARRRFGAEALEAIVAPVLAGIFAGDPDELSMASTFPQFVELERKYGSLILGMRARTRPLPSAGGKLTMFMTLKGGLSRIIEELAFRLPPGCVRAATAVSAVSRTQDGYSLSLSDGSQLSCRHLVSCAPANKASAFLRPLDAGLAREVSGIPFSTTATVSLAYQAEGFGHPLDGFGFVVDRRERRAVMAGTYSSTKFPGRGPKDKVIIRCFLGGAGREDAVAEENAGIIRAVRADLRELLGIDQEPIEARAYRWENANPQYNVGHAARLARIEALLGRHPGLVLAGASYKGVGIPDCVRSGQEAAKFLLEASDSAGGAVR